MLDKIKMLFKNKVFLISFIGGLVVLVGIGAGLVFLGSGKKNYENLNNVENKIQNDASNTEEENNSNHEDDKKNDVDQQDKEDKKDQQENEGINKNVPSLDGYLKTIQYDPFTERDYKIDAKHIVVGEVTKSNQGVTQKYKITMNGVTKDLVAKYEVKDDDIKYTLLLNNKVVEEETYFYKTIFEIVDAIENDVFYFKPEYLTFIKGQDDKEYVLLEKVSNNNGSGYHVEEFILNDNFEKLSVTLNGKKQDVFVVYDEEYNFVNMDQYSVQFGYKSEKLAKDDKHYNRNFIVKDGKVRYWYVDIEECTKNYTATEYEFTITDNAIHSNQLKKQDIFWNTEGNC